MKIEVNHWISDNKKIFYTFQSDEQVSSTVIRLEESLVEKDQKIAELEAELNQQKFNNKHNLSIDQQVSDRIKELEQKLSAYQEKLNATQKNRNELIEMLDVKNSWIKELEGRLNRLPTVDGYEILKQKLTAAEKKRHEQDKWIKGLDEKLARAEAEVIKRGENFNALRKELTAAQEKLNSGPWSETIELNKKLKVAGEALEFYAAKSSYYVNGKPNLHNHIVDSDLGDLVISPDCYITNSLGGKRAREALKQIQGV